MNSAGRAVHKGPTLNDKTSIGFLLNPSEALTLDLPARWTLRTAVAQETLDVFRDHERTSAIVSEGLQLPSASFWVLAYQAARRQHCVFLPLVGPTVLDLLRDAPQHGVVLLLEAPDGSALAAQIEVASEQARALLSAHVSMEDCPDVVGVVRDAASVLRQKGLLPPDGTPSPLDVCLGFILPPELVSPDES